MKSRNINVLKIITAVVVLAILAGVTIYLFPIMKNIATPEGQAEFKNLIQNSGIKGLLILFALELAQILLAILPGEPLEILAGMCYGGFWGTVFIVASVAITTTIIVLAVRKFGKGLIYQLNDAEQIKKIENSKWFKNPQNIEYILIILFMIPGTPKDLLTYFGGILPVKTSRFIVIATIARFPSIISSTLAGANMMKGNWLMMVVVYVVPLLMALAVIAIMKKNEKAREIN